MPTHYGGRAYNINSRGRVSPISGGRERGLHGAVSAGMRRQRGVRMGAGGGFGLIALSSGQKALESFRYGQIGTGMMNLGLAAGAGWMAHGAITNSRAWRSAMRSSSSALLNYSKAKPRTMLGNVAGYVHKGIGWLM
jgi:hypothetical protein